MKCARFLSSLLLMVSGCAAEVLPSDVDASLAALRTDSDLNFYRTLTTPDGQLAIAYTADGDSEPFGDVVGKRDWIVEAWRRTYPSDQEPSAVFLPSVDGGGCWATTARSWQFASFSNLDVEREMLYEGVFYDEHGVEYFDPQKVWPDKRVFADLLTDAPLSAVEVTGCQLDGSDERELAFDTEAKLAERVSAGDEERRLLTDALRQSDAFWEAYESFERSRRRHGALERSFTEPLIEGWDTGQVRYFIVSHHFATDEDVGCGQSFVEEVSILTSLRNGKVEVLTQEPPTELSIVHVEGDWHLIDLAAANASVDPVWEGCSC